MKFKYKKFIGVGEHDKELNEYHGFIVGIKDVIHFMSKKKETLEQAFIDSVEDYIETCKEMNKIPEKSYSGEFLLRIKPETHYKIAANAMYKGMSVNSYIDEILRKNV